MSRIIEVKVLVRINSGRLTLITLTKTLVILDIKKSESNNNVLLYTEQTKQKNCHDPNSKHSLANLDIIFFNLLLHRWQATQCA